jgi:hypothetical protein
MSPPPTLNAQMLREVRNESAALKNLMCAKVREACECVQRREKIGPLAYAVEERSVPARSMKESAKAGNSEQAHSMRECEQVLDWIKSVLRWNSILNQPVLWWNYECAVFDCLAGVIAGEAVDTKVRTWINTRFKSMQKVVTDNPSMVYRFGRAFVLLQVLILTEVLVKRLAQMGECDVVGMKDPASEAAGGPNGVEDPASDYYLVMATDMFDRAGHSALAALHGIDDLRVHTDMDTTDYNWTQQMNEEVKKCSYRLQREMEARQDAEPLPMDLNVDDENEPENSVDQQEATRLGLKAPAEEGVPMQPPYERRPMWPPTVPYKNQHLRFPTWPIICPACIARGDLAEDIKIVFVTRTESTEDVPLNARYEVDFNCVWQPNKRISRLRKHYRAQHSEIPSSDWPVAIAYKQHKYREKGKAPDVYERRLRDKEYQLTYRTKRKQQREAAKAEIMVADLKQKSLQTAKI